MYRDFTAFTGLCALALGLAAAAPALAQAMPGAEQAAPEPVFFPPSDEAVAWSQTRGRTLFLYDQAAWFATDAFLEHYDEEALAPYLRGFVIVPDASAETGDDERLDVIFIGDFGEGPVEVARYTLSGEDVVAGGIHAPEDRLPLTPQAERLAAARYAAMQVAMQMQVVLCADSQPTVLVIPDGEVAEKLDVYILTPMTTTEHYPLGGHYRISVEAPLQITQLHALETDCPVAPIPEFGDDAQAVVQEPVSFVRAAEPSEIHVLASYMMPVPLYVETPRSNAVWVVDQGTIRRAGEADMMDAPAGVIVGE